MVACMYTEQSCPLKYVTRNIRADEQDFEEDKDAGEFCHVFAGA
jgi:hypothetical protein